MLVRIELYRPQDRCMINDWLAAHGMPWINGEEIPTIGFIALVDDTPTAAGFLRACEGRVAIFDSLITNPGASSHARNAAIEMIVEKILDVARICKFKRVLALSVDKNTITRAMENGFEKKDLSVLTLTL